MKSRILLIVLLSLSSLGGVFSYFKWQSLGIDPLALDARSYYEMNVIYAEESRVISGFSGRLNSLATIGFLFVLHLFLENKVSKLKALILILTFFALTVSPRRAAMFDTLASGLLFWYLAKRPAAKKTLAVGLLFGLVFILIFGYSQFHLGKMSEFSLLNSIEAALSYFNDNLYAMSNILNTDHFAHTWIVMSNPMRIAGQIFDFTPDIDLSIPFVFVPDQTNTVPAFYYFYRSGGFLGVVFFGFVIGFISLLSARKYLETRSFFYGVLAILLLTGVALSVRECFFISYDFSFWLFSAYIINLILVKRFRWKKEF